MCADRSEKEEEKEFIIEFIELYRSLTSLWDVKSRNYMDRQKREAESGILLEKYQERYPEATKKDVSRKINVLRSNFKRELRRLNDLSKSGAGVNEDNTSVLWYFDALRFIQDVETPSSSRSNVQEMEEEPQKKKRKTVTATDELVNLASQRLKEKRSAFRAASEVWALKLESMDPNQAIVAEKMINDIIYDAQLERLHVSSTPTSVSRTSTPLSPFDYNPSSSSSEINMSQSAFLHSNAPKVVYIRPPTPSPSQTNVVYVRPSMPCPPQTNVGYSRTPTPSAPEQIFFQHSQTSPELFEEEYIVDDDDNPGQIQSFFSSFK